MITIRSIVIILCALSSLGLPGCQRYAPAPLDLAGHRRVVQGRDPGSPEVVEYSRRLAGRDTDGTVPFDPADGLSLREAEAVLLFFNPDLRAARLRARVPRVGAAEAGRWEDPELRLDAERIVEGVEHPWVLGGVLNLTLPVSGRLKAEKSKALAEADVEQLRLLVEEQRLVAELRASWLEWSATVEQAILTEMLVRELDALVTTADKLRAAGELDPLDARLFRIERMTQAGKLQALEAQARVEEMELKARLGLYSSAPVRLNPSLSIPTRPFPTEPDATRAREVESHPRVRVAKAEYEVAERTLQLEIKKQYPDLSVGGGFGTDEGIERVLGGIGVPLPLWNRNRRGIAEALAARDAARAAAEAEYERVLSDVAKARAASDAATARLRFVETELAPLVDEQLAAARQLGRLGNHNTLVLLEAIKAAYDAKSEVLQARSKVGLAAARLASVSTSAGSVAADETAGKDVRR